jgi:PleD family two-component response regulator
VVNEKDWAAGAFETVLEPAGFAVARSYTQREGIRRARMRGPDAIIIDSRLPDGDGPAACAALTAAAEVGYRTPLLISYESHTTAMERRAAFRSGAWQLIEPPVDGEALILQLEAYVRVKREVDRFRAARMLDEETGLYAGQAIRRRADELVAWASRAHEPLTCLAFAPESAAQLGTVVELLGRALKEAGRRSDSIGRADPTEFVVLAPGTDSAGARRMAERLAAATGLGTGDQLRAGFEVLEPTDTRGLTGVDLLLHAHRALDRAENGEGWIARWREAAA